MCGIQFPKHALFVWPDIISHLFFCNSAVLQLPTFLLRLPTFLLRSSPSPSLFLFHQFIYLSPAQPFSPRPSLSLFLSSSPFSFFLLLWLLWIFCSSPERRTWNVCFFFLKPSLKLDTYMTRLRRCSWGSWTNISQFECLKIRRSANFMKFRTTNPRILRHWNCRVVSTTQWANISKVRLKAKYSGHFSSQEMFQAMKLIRKKGNLKK